MWLAILHLHAWAENWNSLQWVDPWSVFLFYPKRQEQSKIRSEFLFESYVCVCVWFCGMSVSTSISRNGINGCDSAPTTTSGCSGTDYAQSHQSQFDIMFQEVQERMYKLFERYSQLKERNRHMASARQSAADDSEPESKISTSKTILTVGTTTQEERGEDTGSETSCRYRGFRRNRNFCK